MAVENRRMQPLVPLRMLNEYVYCPRLAILEWVEGEFAQNADTVAGSLRHVAVDRPGRRFRTHKRSKDESVVPAQGDTAPIHGVEQLRSIELSDIGLGITGKLDLVEIEGDLVRPVDTKKGRRPHVPRGAYDPERVQLCGQGLLLRANGRLCEAGALYFAGSGERVEVIFDDELIDLTLRSIHDLQQTAEADSLPPPLEDSPKCVRCSLAPVCLPDETRNLCGVGSSVRPLFPSATHQYPLYVQTAGSRVRKKGDVLEVWSGEEKVGEMRTREISQLVLMGRAHATEPVVRELMQREVPIVHLSQGGWLYGVTECLPHKNVHLRQCQFRLADDPSRSLKVAREFVRSKILNQRVLLRRNAGAALAPGVIGELGRIARDALRAESIDTLLGQEGRAARVYFANFGHMLKARDESVPRFDFEGRNRRPPMDPINALLSFAYAMLAREWTAVLRGVGFDPYLGFLHQPRYGRPALVLDMMETFRPIIADSTVVRVINNGEIGKRDFVERLGAVNLNAAGRRAFLQAFENRLAQEITHPVFGYRLDYRRVFEIEARLLARHIQGELPQYRPLVTR